MEKLFVFTDGGARGNPGPAAIGVVIKSKADEEKIICQFGKFIGVSTNNAAEYMAVIEALKWLKEKLPITNYQSPIVFFLDSRLVVNQLNGLFKIKDANLRGLLLKIRELEQELGSNVSYQLIPRQKNWLADSLVKKAFELMYDLGA